MEKQKSIPELRFPGFEGEWEEKTLGKLAEIIMGQSPDGDSYNTEGIGIPLINGPVEFTEKYPVKIKWTSKPSKYCQDKDVLFCVRGSTTGRMNIANDRYCIGRGVAAIRANEKSTSVFIELILIKNLERILSFTTGSTFQNIDSKSLKDFQFSIPSLPEQTKIANFLSSVDDKLTQLKKKKTLLESYKKGVMQKIFYKEIRFKDENGKEFPEWEEKKLGEVADNILYGMNAAAIPYDGENKYIRITDIDENSRRFIPNPLSSPDCEIEEKYKLKEGDIVFARTGASVGKTYLYNINDGNLVFAGFLIKFSIVNANPYFIFIQTFLESYNKWVLTMSMRSGQPGINAEEYKTFPVHLPYMNEQIKIANFLSAIDEKINHCSNQIEKMEKWKKGLLQKMFV